MLMLPQGFFETLWSHVKNRLKGGLCWDSTVTTEELLQQKSQPAWCRLRWRLCGLVQGARFLILCNWTILRVWKPGNLPIVVCLKRFFGDSRLFDAVVILCPTPQSQCVLHPISNACVCVLHPASRRCQYSVAFVKLTPIVNCILICVRLGGCEKMQHFVSALLTALAVLEGREMAE